MLIFVVTLNCAITLMNFIVAWKIWRSRRQLRQATRWLRSANQSVQEVLEPAPELIALGQFHLRQFRRSSQHWLHQWVILQELLSILALINFVRRRQR